MPLIEQLSAQPVTGCGAGACQKETNSASRFRYRDNKIAVPNQFGRYYVYNL
jgi:hypothetical protein